MPPITTPWTVADYLGDDEAAAADLDACPEDGDPKLLAAALGNIARAEGITDLAARTGLPVDALDHALSAQGGLEVSIVLTIVAALGLRLTALQKVTEAA